MAYEKQTWNTTSYVNPTRMNHIEDGIDGIQYVRYARLEPTTNETWASLFGRLRDTGITPLSTMANFARIITTIGSSGRVFQCFRVASSATTSVWVCVNPSSTGITFYAISISSTSATLRSYAFTTSGLTITDMSSETASTTSLYVLDVKA